MLDDCKNTVPLDDAEYDTMCSKVAYSNNIYIHQPYCPSCLTQYQGLLGQTCDKGNVTKGIYGLFKSTPYWGMLYELEIRAINLLLAYMVYPTLVNSKEERVPRKILMEQEAFELKECWYGNLRMKAGEIGIEFDK